MECITSYEMCKIICQDHGIWPTSIHKTYFNQYKVVNGIRKIRAPFNAVIVTNEGEELPYMLPNGCRNEAALASFDFIYVKTFKSLLEVIKEANVGVKTSKCKISEGGGWYSQGLRYTYKDFYCEI